MARYQYGGQALIEGVLMRGRNALAVALRHPDGSIVWAVERLDLGLRARRALKMPFLRGLVVLYDTLVTGTRWLVRSATIQALGLEAQQDKPGSAGPAASVGGILRSLALVFSGPALCAAADSTPGDAIPPPAYTDPDAASPKPVPAEEGLGKGYAVAVGGMLLLSLVIGIAVFFLLPLLLAQATVGRVDQGFALQLSEGGIRVVIFLGYLILVGRAADVRRTFQYHGAEHMSIHTLEAGDPLTVEAARKYPTAHPRCGTEFLVVVLIVSILAFAVVGKLPPLWLIVSRVVLVPVIAAISYELLQLGARHRNYAIVRWLWSPGIWVQAITTRQPSDDMIEVAIVSLERALVADGNEIPDGSSDYAARPLNPDAESLAAAAAPSPAPAPKATAATASATSSSAGTGEANAGGVGSGTAAGNPAGVDS
jgi:uncharacterized protein YqhQ